MWRGRAGLRASRAADRMLRLTFAAAVLLLKPRTPREARDRVHAGWRLAAHPLAGSVRLLRSPYRSLVLVQDRRPADARHVQMIEEAVARLESRELLDQSPENAGDYRLLDLDLLRRVLESLGD